MNRFFTTAVLVLMALCGIKAQPAAVKNVAKATFCVTAYAADGHVMSTTNGVFVSPDGQAVCSWSALKEAARADVTDNTGKTYPVKYILGANDIYDVCHIKIDAKTVAAQLATTALPKDSKVWLVENVERKNVFTQYEVDKAETFMDKYSYYVFGYNKHTGSVGAAFVNERGQVVGLFQQSGRSLYANAVDAGFASSLATGTLDVGNVMYAKTNLRLKYPNTKKDAQLMLMLAGERCDSAKYAGYISDYISLFPHDVDGYSTGALNRLTYGDYKGADALMQKALKDATDKAEAHSEYARVMYQKLIYGNDSSFTDWTLDKALSEAQKAYSMNAQPAYLHRVAQIKFSKGDYQDACGMFEQLCKTDLRSSEVFFEVAQCKTQLGAPKTEILEMLDSAVATCQRPLNNMAAPYILARGQLYDQMEDYRKAIADYNVYDTLMYGRATAEFYYTRYQAEVKIRQYQQALNDIAHAAYVGGSNTPLYLAEMGSLQLRVNMYEDAIKTSDLCLSLDADNTDALVIKGLALIMTKKKVEGLELLEKAKTLGDSRAEGYIEKYK